MPRVQSSRRIRHAAPAVQGGSAIRNITELRAECAAIRVHHEKLGIRKSLTGDQLARAAAPFEADSSLLSAAKKLIDSRHPKYKAVVNVRHRATQFWKSVTVPYPEPGIRLVRRSMIPEFDQQMATFGAELAQAVTELQECYETLCAEARHRLGDLFNVADYPQRIDDQFSLSWDYPSVEPPDYLRQISPRLYEQEQERIRQRFEQAMTLAEQTFTAQLSELVTHLVERLSGDSDGKPKVFRDSAVQNLREFFTRFGQLNIRSNGELDALVDRAQRAVEGVNPETLRTDNAARRRVAEQLGSVKEVVDRMMIDRPSRKISLDSEE